MADVQFDSADADYLLSPISDASIIFGLDPASVRWALFPLMGSIGGELYLVNR